MASEDNPPAGTAPTEATRQEQDFLGPLAVPADAYWGIQTQRALTNFPIGRDRMAPPFIRALVRLKQAAVRANRELGAVPPDLADAIDTAADDVLSGRLGDQFPLPVWQTGSGTGSNMNANEVLANRANEILGAGKGAKSPVHPNNHVNRGQSSNDSVPTAMHIAVLITGRDRLLPALERLTFGFEGRARAFEGVVKTGRTHFQDAVPIAAADEFRTFVEQLKDARARLDFTLDRLRRVPQGGTAVGSGLNAHGGFAAAFCRHLSRLTGIDFTPHPHKFTDIANHDSLVAVSGALNDLAVSLLKISNDLRFLASGPRCGLNELILEANEPGSSIMPGKVNPTQIEALSMVAAQAMGNHVACTIGGTQGHLQLNAFKPLIVQNILHSMEILADAMESARERCVATITLNKPAIARTLEKSLMLVTALVPHVGYDKAAEVARLAHDHDLTLREAAEKLGDVAAPEDLARWLDPAPMARPHG